MESGEQKQNPERLSDDEISQWFLSKGVTLAENISGSEASDLNWLKEVGVISSSDTHLSTNIVTGNFLKGKKEFKDGWFRGGGESFYKIVEVNYRSQSGEKKRKLIAFKAIHSMGNIKSKTFTEAAWMAQIASQGRCGNIYSVVKGIVVKDFLEEDPSDLRMTPEKKRQEEEKILAVLTSAGLKPIRRLETIQHGGKLMAIDLGSGDISGPNIYDFIAHNS